MEKNLFKALFNAAKQDNTKIQTEYIPQKDSEVYGSPTTISYGPTRSRGIPVNSYNYATALEQLFLSEQRKDKASKAIGGLLGYSDGHNKARMGKRAIDQILTKFYTGNKPNGVVIYSTNEGKPSTGRSRIAGYYRHSNTPSQTPDTLVNFGFPYPDFDETVETAVHEPLHAIDSWRTRGNPDHQEPFNEAVDSLLSNYDNKMRLYNAARGKPNIEWLEQLIR